MQIGSTELPVLSICFTDFFNFFKVYAKNSNINKISFDKSIKYYLLWGIQDH